MIKRSLIISIILLLIIFKVPLEQQIAAQLQFAKLEQTIIIETSNIESEPIASRDLEETRNPVNLELTVNSDLREISNLTADDFDTMLENTALYGLGEALEQVENEYSINGLYIMGLACLESAYGKSNYARNRNNLVGWNAVDSNPDKATYFDSKADCILFISSKLKSNYLTENGIYFSGYSARDIDVHYCTDKAHADKIVQIVNKLIKKL